MDGLLGRVLFSWIANALAIGVAVALIGSINATGLGAIVLAGLVFGVVNLLVKPVLTLLTLPLHVITLGLSLFFVNMAMFALTAWIVDDLDVGGFWSVVEGTVIIWVVDVIVHTVWGRVDAPVPA
jgi:putative membrane protein